MEICKAHMKHAIPHHPLAVLGYASRHEYPDLCDEAAPRSIAMSVADGFRTLDSITFIHWVLYREVWMGIVQKHDSPPVVLHKGGLEDSESWHAFRANILTAIGLRPEKLWEVNRLFELDRDLLDDCKYCRMRADRWERLIQSQIECVPKWSSVHSYV
ncbi:hypothetical protein AcW1_007445 [Taiwanofungus camphoratus]|nr:hypothetical protein AcW1_007445 [Antrodia cinnamomea]